MNKLIYNALSGILQKLLTAILVFISVPVFITKLGVDNYGLFTILSIIGNLNIFANLGLNTSLLVYLSKQNKGRQSDCDIIANFLFSLGFTGFITTAIWVFRAGILTSVLGISENDFSIAASLLSWLLGANCFLFIGQLFIAILDSQQKIAITNLCQFFYNLVYWIGLIAVVSLGGSFREIGIVLFISAFLWFLLMGYWAKRTWGRMAMDFTFREIGISIKKQLKYGSKVYLSGLCGFMFEPLSKLLLSHFIGLSAVALFEIASKIRNNINDLIIKGLYPLNPYIAATPVSERLNNQIVDLSQKIQLIVVQGGILISFLIPYVLDLWIREESLADLGLFTIVLTLNLLLLSPPSLPIYLYLLNKDMAEKTAYIQMSSVIANILVFLLLYRLVGVYAILLSNLAGYLSSFLLCKYYQYRILYIPIQKEVRYLLKILLMGISTLAFNYGVYLIIGKGILNFVVFPVTTCLLTIIQVRYYNLIKEADLNNYFRTLPYFRSFLYKIFVA